MSKSETFTSINELLAALCKVPMRRLFIRAIYKTGNLKLAVVLLLSNNRFHFAISNFRWTWRFRSYNMNSSNVVAHKHKIVATAFKFFSGRLFCLYNNSPSFWHVCDRKCQWGMPGCRAIFSNSDDVRISQWNPITQMSCGELWCNYNFNSWATLFFGDFTELMLTGVSNLMRRVDSESQIFPLRFEEEKTEGYDAQVNF